MKDTPLITAAFDTLLKIYSLKPSTAQPQQPSLLVYTARFLTTQSRSGIIS